MGALESLARCIVGNRRRHKRKPMVYRATLVDELNQVLFQGKSLDISRSGARIRGLPSGAGPTVNALVRIDFLVIPRDSTKRAFKAAVTGYVCRIEEVNDDYILAVKFNQFLRT